MIRHVLFHVGPKAHQVVAHAAALVRSGGFVYLVDTDLGSMRLEPDDAGAAEIWRRYAAFQRTRGNNPKIGPQLHVLVAKAGLAVTAVDAWFSVVPGQMLAQGGGAATAAQHAMVAAGALTEDEAQRFDEARERAAANPLTYVFQPQFVAIGRRPA